MWFLHNAINRLCTYLKLKPNIILKQAFITAFLQGSGDVICQSIIEKKNLSEYSPKRTATFCCLGFFFAGPTLTVWLTYLNQRFAQDDKHPITKKVLLHQFIFIPAFISVYLPLLHTMQGKSVQEVKTLIKRDIGHILIANVQFWPAVMISMYYFVPHHYHVFYNQFAALLWNTYLSYKTQKAQKIDKVS